MSTKVKEVSSVRAKVLSLALAFALLFTFSPVMPYDSAFAAPTAENGWEGAVAYPTGNDAQAATTITSRGVETFYIILVGPDGEILTDPARYKQEVYDQDTDYVGQGLTGDDLWFARNQSPAYFYNMFTDPFDSTQDVVFEWWRGGPGGRHGGFDTMGAYSKIYESLDAEGLGNGIPVVEATTDTFQTSTPDKGIAVPGPDSRATNFKWTVPAGSLAPGKQYYLVLEKYNTVGNMPGVFDRSLNTDIVFEFMTQADKTALEALMTSAQALPTDVSTSVDGRDITAGDKWVTAEEMQALQDAIAAAQAVIDDTHALQTKVYAAETALQSAADTFSAAIKTDFLRADFTTLNATIATADGLLATTVSADGTDIPVGTTWITSAGLTDLAKAIGAARTVSSNEYAYQADVDAADTALLDAIAAAKALMKDGTYTAPAPTPDPVSKPDPSKTQMKDGTYTAPAPTPDPVSKPDPSKTQTVSTGAQKSSGGTPKTSDDSPYAAVKILLLASAAVLATGTSVLRKSFR